MLNLALEEAYASESRPPGKNRKHNSSNQEADIGSRGADDRERSGGCVHGFFVVYKRRRGARGLDGGCFDLHLLYTRCPLVHGVIHRRAPRPKIALVVLERAARAELARAAEALVSKADFSLFFKKLLSLKEKDHGSIRHEPCGLVGRNRPEHLPPPQRFPHSGNRTTENGFCMELSTRCKIRFPWCFFPTSGFS